MVDTVRTMAALQTLLADNTTGAITPQAVRDMLVSVFAYSSPISGSFLSPVNGTYTIDISATEGYTINSLFITMSSGTLTLTVRINGVAVTGMSALAISSAQSTFNATALNSVPIGAAVTFLVASASSPGTLDFKILRTAA
jgi:hypothetical protein